MAFMMPVMKNNYDIYKDGRSRKTSECSNHSSNGVTTVSSAMGISNAMGGGRSRKVSECKSESFASSPSHNSGAYRMQMQRCQSSRAFPRNASRSSNAGGVLSPTRSYSQSSSPPKTVQSRNASNASSGGGGNNNAQSEEISKFHLRLVEKLRKSFRKDSAKRS